MLHRLFSTPLLNFQNFKVREKNKCFGRAQHSIPGAKFTPDGENFLLLHKTKQPIHWGVPALAPLPP